MSQLKPTNWFSNLLREHPALLVSLLYVVASTIGMFYSWSYLRHFGINVFMYAQVGDFLLVWLYVYAMTQAEDTRDGEGQIVEVALADASKAKSALLLGTTGQLLFLYDTATEQVDIHPFENIESVSFTAPSEN